MSSTIDLPSVTEGLRRLRGTSSNDLAVVEELYAPAASVVQSTLNDIQLDDNVPSEATLKKIRDELARSFDQSGAGALLSKYVLDRRRQMTRLHELGPDVLATLLSQGVMPAHLAEALGVGYELFDEYINRVFSEERKRTIQRRAADVLVAEGMTELMQANDKDDLAIAKATAEMKLKLARTMSNAYMERKMPTTAVQVNHAPGADPQAPHAAGGADRPPAFLQVVMPSTDELPELKPHRFQTDPAQSGKPEVAGIIDGEFTLFEEDET